MNNIEIQKGKDQMKKISLTKDEKSQMLQNLSLYADLNMPIPKPDMEKVLNFWGLQINTRVAYVLASILFMALIGGGAVYASENSLPGDLLYPIKTKITEPIVKTLSITQEAKAKIETRLTEKRLKEADELDRKGKLTSETKKILNEKIDRHIIKYSEAKQKVKEEENTEKADIIEKNFKDKIEKYSRIMDKLDRPRPTISENNIEHNNAELYKPDTENQNIEDPNRYENQIRGREIINLAPNRTIVKTPFQHNF